MAFKQRNNQPDFSRLRAVLNNADISAKNNALYQTVSELIDRIQQSRDDIVNNISGIINNININIINILNNATFLTATDESALLPLSRHLIAGTGVTFDDTVANQRTVNVVSGAFDDYVVLSDGGIPTAAPVNDGAGSFIYVQYTP